MHPLITSHQNPKIRNVIALEKQRERSAQRVFIIEGLRELSLARESGYQFNTVFFCPDIVDVETVMPLAGDERLIIPVERSVFEKITYRESTEGVLAVATQRPHTLAALRLKENPVVVILESVEKPGNLGAVLRTADASAADAVIICDPKTDLYNPNVIRSSVGCMFTVQVAVASTDETIAWLHQNNIRIVVTDLEASVPYHTVDYTQAVAIVMGTEATGITQPWREHAAARIIIPMRGKIDSMNVSNATAVIIFESMRQRGFQ